MTEKKEEKVEFKAEVSKVLDIVIHSLYSNAEIFLRELVSNASDACDKLRYALLIHPELAPETEPTKITIEPNAKNDTLTITDTGIGMTKEDLINHLGTIARSGSAEFISALTGDKQKDMALIGQFGVGFYAAFMVADKVTVYTRKVGADSGYVWESTGTDSFTISADETLPIGTSVVLHLKPEAKEYLEPVRLRYLIRQYSDHIEWPIILKNEDKTETINSSSALWAKPKTDISPKQYKDFYQTVSHAFDDPWMTLHYKAEGIINYTALMFIPTKQPFNLFQPDRKSGIQLYVNRVFISDDIKGIMPNYLRFVTGVIDTNDLPLNVSREMLQKTPVIAKIKKGIVKRILSELKKRAEDKTDYLKFWESFGIVFKEGLYEPVDEREEVAELCRFHSTLNDDIISFADYVNAMRPEQEHIYYLSGKDVNTLKNNPQLEGFIARKIPVLLLTDPIDEFWVQTYQDYKGKKFVSVMHAKQDLEKIALDAQQEGDVLSEKQSKAITKQIKKVLGDKINDVQLTERLTKSPIALITPEGQMSLHLEQLMKAHGQQIAMKSERVVEINPRHPLILKLADLIERKESEDKVNDAIWVLYDQTLIAEGEPISDPALFTKRLSSFILSGL